MRDKIGKSPKGWISTLQYSSWELRTLCTGLTDEYDRAFRLHTGKNTADRESWSAIRDSLESRVFSIWRAYRQRSMAKPREIVRAHWPQPYSLMVDFVSRVPFSFYITERFMTHARALDFLIHSTPMDIQVIPFGELYLLESLESPSSVTGVSHRIEDILERLSWALHEVSMHLDNFFRLGMGFSSIASQTKLKIITFSLLDPPLGCTSRSSGWLFLPHFISFWLDV